MTASRLIASAAVLVMALGLVQCTPTTGTTSSDSASTSATASTTATSSAAASTTSVAAVDTPYAYDVALTFTPAATARMHALSEQVTLNATYYGDATPGASGATPAGQLMLGSDSKSVDATTQTVHITGQGFDTSHLTSLSGAPSMLITVASNAGSANNVLNCDLFQDKVSAGQGHAIALSCDAVS